MLRGLRRRSSPPGRCRITTRSAPTSELVPSSTTPTGKTVAARPAGPPVIERMCDRLGVVEIAVQGSLFEHIERRELGDGAFIEIRAGWLTDADDLLDGMLSAVPWREERRQMYDRVVDVPRLVSFHDLTVDDPPHPLLARLRRRLNDIYAGELGEPFTTVGLCCYRDGSDSVAWHGDTIGAAALRTPWWRSSASAPPAHSPCGGAAAARRCGCRRRTGTCW
ncbi:hypothetical protein MSEO_28330 [Mycobacterium seoulense]|uniref:Alpha-ketoglutarate-dependent dioxygenase AlkB n=1 Tax=Mycobacterium seoulense TaxID=386911 RepID=A0A7I7P1H5_9MYCO|nr:hypothetical protein MSEO_28330 [Mycobacterium seoulense]